MLAHSVKDGQCQGRGEKESQHFKLGTSGPFHFISYNEPRAESGPFQYLSLFSWEQSRSERKGRRLLRKSYTHTGREAHLARLDLQVFTTALVAESCRALAISWVSCRNSPSLEQVILVVVFKQPLAPLFTLPLLPRAIPSQPSRKPPSPSDPTESCLGQECHASCL